MCEDCGLSYAAIGWSESTVHDDDWAAITPEVVGHDRYDDILLCVPCIYRRAAKYLSSPIRIAWFLVLSYGKESPIVVQGDAEWVKTEIREQELWREHRVEIGLEQHEGLGWLIRGIIAKDFKDEMQGLGLSS